MQIITGRLTQDAQVRITKSDKQVVNFTLAMNDEYRKDGVKKKVTVFVNCAYWFGTKISDYLTKGSVVNLYGRMSTHSYVDMRGEAQSVLDFFIKEIQFIGSGRKKQMVTAKAAVPEEAGTKDDLPF